MALALYNITFTPASGSLGTFIEYRETSVSGWSVPSSPPNPTTLNTYPLYLEIGKEYVIRMSSVGVNCTAKYRYVVIPVGTCCPPGYTLSDDGLYCFLNETTAATPPSAPENAVSVTNAFFTRCGTQVMDEGFSINGDGPHSSILDSVAFWNNNGGSVCESGNLVNGPMNRTAIWSTTTLDNQTVGFTVCLTVAESKIYYLGTGFDNYGQIVVDGTTILQNDNTTTLNPLENWVIFPVFITSGNHVLEIIGHNGVSTPPNPGAIGVEIYNNTREEILFSTGYGDLDVLFSSADYIGQPIQIGSDGIGYTCPDGYALVLCDGPAYCQRTLVAAPIVC